MTRCRPLVLLASLFMLLVPAIASADANDELTETVRLIPGTVIALRIPPNKPNRKMILVASATGSPFLDPGPESALLERVRREEMVNEKLYKFDEEELFTFGALIPAPGKDMVRISLKQDQDSGILLLFFDNGYKKRIVRYEATLIFRDGRTEPTTVCPGKPNLRTAEYWDDDIAAIDISGLSFVPKGGDMSCGY